MNFAASLTKDFEIDRASLERVVNVIVDEMIAFLVDAASMDAFGVHNDDGHIEAHPFKHDKRQRCVDLIKDLPGADAALAKIFKACKLPKDLAALARRRILERNRFKINEMWINDICTIRDVIKERAKARAKRDFEQACVSLEERVVQRVDDADVPAVP
jgi:hypothetical protein